MRIIDLLNIKWNNNQLPLKIKFDTEIYELINGYYRRYHNDREYLLNSEYDLFNCLNDEVEIIEEPKEIEKLKANEFKYTVSLQYNAYQQLKMFNDLSLIVEKQNDKINELVEAVNELKGKKLKETERN